MVSETLKKSIETQGTALVCPILIKYKQHKANLTSLIKYLKNTIIQNWRKNIKITSKIHGVYSSKS